MAGHRQKNFARFVTEVSMEAPGPVRGVTYFQQWHSHSFTHEQSYPLGRILNTSPETPRAHFRKAQTRNWRSGACSEAITNENWVCRMGEDYVIPRAVQFPSITEISVQSLTNQGYYGRSALEPITCSSVLRAGSKLRNRGMGEGSKDSKAKVKEAEGTLESDERTQSWAERIGPQASKRHPLTVLRTPSPQATWRGQKGRPAPLVWPRRGPVRTLPPHLRRGGPARCGKSPRRVGVARLGHARPGVEPNAFPPFCF